VDAGCPRGFDACALLGGPVLVVADGEEDLVLEQLRAAPFGLRPAPFSPVPSMFIM